MRLVDRALVKFALAAAASVQQNYWPPITTGKHYAARLQRAQARRRRARR